VIKIPFFGIKVKVSLFLIEHHAMKVDRRVEIQLRIFLTPTLD
jgi:hypothetical protein